MDDEMENSILDRTKSKRFGQDGLMGQQAYEIDQDAVNSLKWTDLIAPKSETGSEADAESPPSGVSPVRIQELANKRLLSLPLVNSLIHNRKFEYLTPVQAQTILPILRNESMVVRAKTGTGKTGAFAIPILQKVLDAKKNSEQTGKVSALIVSPTRELAQQIADEIFKITQFGGIDNVKVQTFVGGLSKERQLALSGLLRRGDNDVCDIVVATPGRLLDILSDERVRSRFSALKFRVFDEADRILDIGFEREMEDARRILDDCNEGREIPLLLFSATASGVMKRFAQQQFGDRVRVVDTIPKDEPAPSDLVEQHSVSASNWAELYEAASQTIVNEAAAASESHSEFKAIVFLPTGAMVDSYRDVLRGLFGRKSPMYRNIEAIHGGVRQSSRQGRADRFRKASSAVLVTTDVVARGMDFPNVTHVFQLGPPVDVPSYVHRIGRTARIGKSGKSYLFYTHHTDKYIEALKRDNISTQVSTYLRADDEFGEKLAAACQDAVGDEQGARDVLGSFMAYSTTMKAKYGMVPREFLRDLQPFVELMGLESYELSAQMRQSWRSGGGGGGGSRYGRGGGGGSGRGRSQGYRSGSSRQSRMRW